MYNFVNDIKWLNTRYSKLRDDKWKQKKTLETKLLNDCKKEFKGGKNIIILKYYLV